MVSCVARTTIFFAPLIDEPTRDWPVSPPTPHRDGVSRYEQTLRRYGRKLVLGCVISTIMLSHWRLRHARVAGNARMWQAQRVQDVGSVPCVPSNPLPGSELDGTHGTDPT